MHIIYYNRYVCPELKTYGIKKCCFVFFCCSNDIISVIMTYLLVHTYILTSFEQLRTNVPFPNVKTFPCMNEIKRKMYIWFNIGYFCNGGLQKRKYITQNPHWLFLLHCQHWTLPLRWAQHCGHIQLKWTTPAMHQEVRHVLEAACCPHFPNLAAHAHPTPSSIACGRESNKPHWHQHTISQQQPKCFFKDIPLWLYVYIPRDASAFLHFNNSSILHQHAPCEPIHENASYYSQNSPDSLFTYHFCAKGINTMTTQQQPRFGEGAWIINGICWNWPFKFLQEMNLPVFIIQSQGVVLPTHDRRHALVSQCSNLYWSGPLHCVSKPKLHAGSTVVTTLTILYSGCRVIVRQFMQKQWWTTYPWKKTHIFLLSCIFYSYFPVICHTR